ncbi:MAG: Sir2 silent information regulator family NAD-dependent deacetylase [Eubacteriales bacterium]|nr:Sir2 silent information regulator family NAD-dependent deacetylase [Eubacteriales bacterium]
MFFRKKQINENTEEVIAKLKKEIENADAVVIGAGAGLSTSAGFRYGGERFQKYFADFVAKYHYPDEYSGGFMVGDRPLNEFWAFWSRNIYLNRYMKAPKPVYEDLLELVKEKDYFVLTTNVDHCFQRAGFDKQRMFYTQGDYGLWQCSEPCHDKTYDNEEVVKKMVLAQGFTIAENGDLVLPEDGSLKMTVPEELIPTCPVCGKPMSMNLRADDTFVEDEGWYAAKNRFASFLSHHGVSGAFGFVNVAEPTKGEADQKIVYLELGIGGNTPGIIKYPFWQAVYKNPNAVYACINYGQAAAPVEIKSRSICLNSDIGEVFEYMKSF